MNPLLLLVAHNLARWAVLAAAGWALAHAWRGLLARAPWRRGARMPGLVFTTLLNIQLVIGLLLYFNSPLATRGRFNECGFGHWSSVQDHLDHPGRRW